MSDTEVTPSRPLILVATDDGSDSAYNAVRAEGVRLATQRDHAVVLLDRTSESRLTDPFPTGVLSDDSHTIGPDDQLEPHDLEGLGRGYLAAQLRDARSSCMEAYAYLGQGSGADAIADAIERFAPVTVVLPASIDEPSLRDRLKRNTVQQLADEVDVELILVDADGSTRQL